jgi:alpha-mannosidase
VQDQVRQLVAAGQLDFVNGGFVQHDEAAAHYAAMIDQTTRGHRCACLTALVLFFLRYVLFC